MHKAAPMLAGIGQEFLPSASASSCPRRSAIVYSALRFSSTSRPGIFVSSSVLDPRLIRAS
jgi:hypothetical protein